MMIKVEDVTMPLDVPKSMRQKYVEIYLRITRDSGRLMLFAGDHAHSGILRLKPSGLSREHPSPAKPIFELLR
jgi:hypothetical protein